MRSREQTEGDDAEISIHALANVSGPKTMRMGSWIKGRWVMVLIDNGFTHNFLNQEVAKKLKLKVERVDPFHVKVANGEKLGCITIYRGVPIRIQGVTIMADLFALHLGGLDVILGMQWLEKLGDVVTDYKVGTMRLKYGEEIVTLKSETNDMLKEVGIQSLSRMWHKGGRCYAIRIEEVVTPTTQESGKCHYDILHLLSEFDTVLNGLQELPPK